MSSAWGTRLNTLGFSVTSLALTACAPAAAPAPPPKQQPAQFMAAPSTTVAQQCFWQQAPSGAGYHDWLLEVHEVPYTCSDLCKGGSGCGGQAYWALVRAGWDAVPTLVDALDDATSTGITIPNGTGEQYAVADFALEVLNAIVEVPYSELLGIPPSDECGFCSWSRFVNSSPVARKRVKARVSQWLAANADSKVLEPVDVRTLVDCAGPCPSPVAGRYKLQLAKAVDARGRLYEWQFTPCVELLEEVLALTNSSRSAGSDGVRILEDLSGRFGAEVELADPNRTPAELRLDRAVLSRQLEQRKGEGYRRLVALGRSYDAANDLKFDRAAARVHLSLDGGDAVFQLKDATCTLESVALTYSGPVRSCPF